MVAPAQPVCAEYTMCKFESNSAAEFVALQLILDWNKFDGSIENQPSPILKPQFNKVGISLKLHKRCMNIYQVMFVKAAEYELTANKLMESFIVFDSELAGGSTDINSSSQTI